MPDYRIIPEMAQNLGMEEPAVAAVIAEFALQLHRYACEYTGFNGDYIGEDLRYQVPPQALYHLLYFLDRFSEHYSWEPGSAHEYLLRMGKIADWAPFGHQTEGWMRPEGQHGTSEPPSP